MRRLNITSVILLPFLLVIGPLVSLASAGTSQAGWKITRQQKMFLDDLQRDTFRFFWKTANPLNGLIPDHFPGGEYSSIGGVGFALTVYPEGVRNHYVTRAQAAERTLRTLKFLYNAPQSDAPGTASGYKGFFYHFLRMDNGARYEKSELSTIDTALLMAGVLASKSYFDGSGSVETEIRSYADSLYRRVDWPWAYSKKHKPLLSMGWTPEDGFIQYHWAGYSEAMILYILAMGSPTHPIDGSTWTRWTSTYQWSDGCGLPHVDFGPLFGHQYSQVWIDFRGIRDAYMRSKGIDYFINSTRAVYANRAYCIENPNRWLGYGDLVWGLTASDGPGETTVGKTVTPVVFHAYWARGSCVGYKRDDGTVSPTAVGGSVPFAPEITIPTLDYFRTHFDRKLYGRYGFKDAFNLSYPGSSKPTGWFDNQYLAIDQGPILLMVENYRTGFVWDLMKKDPSIKKGLKQAGFTGGWLNN
ncbi:MAG: glucoamylase family protein [Syntrophobacteraceae bacterium]|nr:glucoamylase family protein [Syntrophobacteraceae bacterium]